MKKSKILTHTMSVDEAKRLDDLDLNSDWELKAERLMARRMRKLRQQWI